MFDPEIEAIAKCHELFKVLEDDSKVRVIQWLVSKFELNHPHWSKPTQVPTAEKPAKALPAEAAEVIDIENGGNKAEEAPTPKTDVSVSKTIESYETVAELFADASPSHEWEKALVVAAFLQVKNELSDFTGFEVNKELRNLGHAATNITSSFTDCISKRPQLIIQLRKEGKSQQARKKYKVSTAGINVVNSMLSK